MNKEIKKIKEELKTLTKKVEELEKQEPEYFRVIERGLDCVDFGFIYYKEYLEELGYDSDFAGYFEPVKKPKDEEKYCFIFGGGEIGYAYWDDDDTDNFRWKTGNVFNSEESAERHYKRLIS